jgi:hypothetical protein
VGPVGMGEPKKAVHGRIGETGEDNGQVLAHGDATLGSAC